MTLEDVVTDADFLCQDLHEATDQVELSTSISVDEAVRYFEEQIETKSEPDKRLWRRLRKDLGHARSFALALADLDYDPSCQTHWRILAACYEGLVGEPCDGAWERIGIDGDPQMNCLAALQLLALVEDSSLNLKNRKIASTSIALTAEVLNDFKKGKLNAKCNRASSVLPVLNAAHRDKFVKFKAPSKKIVVFDDLNDLIRDTRGRRD